MPVNGTLNMSITTRGADVGLIDVIAYEEIDEHTRGFTVSPPAIPVTEPNGQIVSNIQCPRTGIKEAYNIRVAAIDVYGCTIAITNIKFNSKLSQLQQNFTRHVKLFYHYVFTKV